MKIKELQISNILSFQFVENILDATKITLDENLNIFIGENGAGKSTALEVLNFIFKKVVFTQFHTNQELYSNRNNLQDIEKKNILTPNGNNSISGFRLDPNWNSENEVQKIRLVVKLDEIDLINITNLVENIEKLKLSAFQYTNQQINLDLPNTNANEYVIEVNFNKQNHTFNSTISPDNVLGSSYLTNYNFYKELISFYNYENIDPISPLYESFTLIGGYRNYNAFNPSVTLLNSSATQQIQEIRDNEFRKSLNTLEPSEPTIFNLVRLRVAEKHYDLEDSRLDLQEREIEANNLPFLEAINKKLKLVNLKCQIRLTNRHQRQYSFEFFDIKRQKPLTNINSLSAGQKAIIHLVFEAYGRGDLKGGLVIIDEPEIHLHYQFQNEYLQVINDINKEQFCQYILVTHSESLINSSTIHNVKRFTLSNEGYTTLKFPSLSTDQKTLVKILDNIRSTSAFFGKKILLVEGETDRYFFKAVINELSPQINQTISIIDINGKSNYTVWKNFFEAFGLIVYFIGDLDSAFKFIYPTEKANKLGSAEKISEFKESHPDVDTKIHEKYSEKIFILKQGSLEFYIGNHNKGLTETINFCNSSLQEFLSTLNEKSEEIISIFNQIVENIDIPEENYTEPVRLG